MGVAASVSLIGDTQGDALLERLTAECGALPATVDRAALAERLRPIYLLAARASEDEAFVAIKTEYRRAVRAAADPAAATAGGAAAYDESYALLKGVQDAVAAAAFVERRWTLVHDPTGRASKFYRYQGGACVNCMSAEETAPSELRKALVSSLRRGSALVLDLGPTEIDVTALCVDETCFPLAALRGPDALFEPATVAALLRDSDGDKVGFVPRHDCVVIVVSSATTPPAASAAAIGNVLHVKPPREMAGSAAAEIASAFGCSEKVRSSDRMVEAAFDGDVEEVKAELEKGYHCDSVDGGGTTALSEAACAGHAAVCKLLIEEGADPNSVNLRDRTPLYRAAYADKRSVVKLLLESGADPDLACDSGGGVPQLPQDVCNDRAVKMTLSKWNRAKTATLKAAREVEIERKVAERVRDKVERDLLAKRKLAEELVVIARAGDVDALSAKLEELAEEAADNREKPRMTAAACDGEGNSLLAIATQARHSAMVERIVTHWKGLKSEQEDSLGEDTERRLVWRVNVNSRNAQGTNPVATAAGNGDTRLVELLLAHGADPRMHNRHGANAFTFAKGVGRELAVGAEAGYPVIIAILDEWQRSVVGEVKPVVDDAAAAAGDGGKKMKKKGGKGGAKKGSKGGGKKKKGKGGKKGGSSSAKKKEKMK